MMLQWLRLLDDTARNMVEPTNTCLCSNPKKRLDFGEIDLLVLIIAKIGDQYNH